MQGAVNPIESLDTWTEFVEGKNKVRVAEGGEGGGEGPSPSLGVYQACRTVKVGDLSAVSQGLPCLNVDEGARPPAASQRS